MELKEALDIMGGMKLVNLATIDGDQPRVRAVILIPHADRFWISSRTSAAKMDQIRQNDRVEISLTTGEEDDLTTLRATGRLIIIEDPDVKKELALQMPFFDKIWDSIDDPNYTLMRLDLSSIRVAIPYRNEAFTFDL